MTFAPALSSVAVRPASRTSPVVNPVPATAVATNCPRSWWASSKVSGPPASGLAWVSNASGEPLVDVTPGASASSVELSVDVNDDTYPAAWVASSFSSAWFWLSTLCLARKKPRTAAAAMTSALTRASGDARQVLSLIAPPRWIEGAPGLLRIVPAHCPNPRGAADPAKGSRAAQVHEGRSGERGESPACPGCNHRPGAPALAKPPPDPVSCSCHAEFVPTPVGGGLAVGQGRVGIVSPQRRRERTSTATAASEGSRAVGFGAGDVVLSITWHPSGLGGRIGVARVSHLDGRDDRRHLDRQQAEALATSYFGPARAERALPGQGVEWTGGPERP